MLKEHFAAGETVALAGADVKLSPILATLKIVFTPPDAVVALAQGTTTIKLSSDTAIAVTPGSYELTVRLGSFLRSVPLDIAVGESRTIGPLSLAPGGIPDFENSTSWKPNKDWFVHRGGDFVLYKTVPPVGTFEFSSMLEKGHRLQWFFNYIDDKNYELFQMDENNFYRSAVHNGEVTEEAKIPFKTEKKKARTFQILATPHRIVHMIQQGNAWVNLDSWQPVANPTAGRFGFYIPGNDEVALSNFSYWADLKLR